MQAIRIYNQDIRMDFDIKKCGMLIMKSGKRQTVEEIELPNQVGWLVGIYGISTFVGYLMANSFLYK